MDVIVSGSSGLIGSALVEALDKSPDHRPIRLVREPAKGQDEIFWDPAEGEIDAASIEGADAVVHLAGAGIADRRWSDEYRQILVNSRTHGTTLLANTLAGLQTTPDVMLSASAIGYYGDRGNEELVETSAPGDGFLPDLCQRWEGAAQPSVDAGIRTCFLRTGIVLSAESGALPKMLPMFKLFLGGRFGDGTQYMAWISLHDHVRAMMHLLDSTVEGPVNLTGPEPVTNAEFTQTLGDVLNRPARVPVPAFGPRLLLGRELADSLLFDSSRVLPEVLIKNGFEFAHPTVHPALAWALN